MNYRLPHLAGQLQIEEWAKSQPAQSKLPNLVRNLIAATVPQVTELTMPGDEHVNLSGYDGLVTSPIETPFVPAGRSVWEFGASNDPKKKANRDYDERTKDSRGIDRSVTTFVFVTPHRWAGGHDWATEKAALNEWKNVQVRTVADLLATLETSPRTHVWFSEEIGVPANGVQTLGSWWESFTSGTRGLLSPELLIAGRRDQATQLLMAISNDASKRMWIAAPDPDDVLSFVAAVVYSADPATRQSLLDRSLVVFEPGALAYLGRTEGLLILVPFEESLVRQADLINGHHIVMHTSVGQSADIELPPVPIGDAEKLLEANGVEKGRVNKLAKAINKSVPLYKRQLIGVSSLAIVTVTGFSDTAIARKSWLLGSWNLGFAGDVAAIERISGTLDVFHHEMDRWLHGASPVFTRVGAAWKVFDHTDSITQVINRITGDDLRSLEAIAQEVLAAVDPKLDLPREDRWKAAIDGKVRSHSADLRKGLASMLAVLGSLESDADRRVDGHTLSGWAQLVVRALLLRANEDKTGKLWESLFDVLSLLAEAAPDTFLDALGLALKPSGPLGEGVFADADHGFLSPTSPHVYLQWALEVLAWSPQYFGATSSLMMTLAQRDPGGALSNRPVSALIGLFLPWRPQTGASLKSRNAVLSKFAKSHPETTWDLLLGLYPGSQSSIVESNGPDFHDWKEHVASSNVSMSEYVEAVDHVVVLSLGLAEADPRRLVDLVGKLDDLTVELRDRVLVLFKDAATKELDPEISESIWKELTSLIRRHREFSDAQWALDESILLTLDSVAELFEPIKGTGRVEWLFEHMPDLGDVTRRDDHEKYQEELTRRQLVAVEEVYEQLDLLGLCELAQRVKTPWSVGYSAASSSKIAFDVDSLAPLVIDTRPGVPEFARAAIAKTLAGNSDDIIALARRHVEAPLVAARVYRLAENLPTVWGSLAEAGEEIESLYWSEFEIYGRGDFELINETAERLGKSGRYAVALDLLALYSHNAKFKLDVELIIQLFGVFSSAEDPERHVLSQYDIGALLDYVEQANVIDVERLGLLQWRLLPALDSSASVKALQSWLATSPEFFVQIISIMYKGTDEDEGIERPKGVAENAWNLLHRWRMIPGTSLESGEIDESVLEQWVLRVRELLAQTGRLDPGEAYIGQVFAFAKADGDGATWPCRPVRDFLENNSSEVIDRNFGVAIYNKRGVTSRGMTDGGVQERSLAEQYEGYAANITDEWPRTARLLRKVAEGYRNEARQHDEEAQRVEEGFDF